ncbi:hypothetical protein EXIGLDRAFT_767044 [Exidia glandulosa HHB12029]|uniref:Uncharacterized protein n=1 Tax=Exidia glandulosa HHB12029 TaxID=1314781 RepID=A0A165J967_EXIGL|nr:hypothetical protein EXIGLDRAFT_767044 [Exidia glandulosa HHB12029]
MSFNRGNMQLVPVSASAAGLGKRNSRSESPSAQANNQPKKKKTSNSQKKPSKAHGPGAEYRIPREKVTDEFRATKKAFELHINVLWGRFDMASIPPRPSAEILARFEKRFKSNDQVYAVLSGTPRIEKTAMARVRRLREQAATSHSLITKNIARIEDHPLEMAFSACARYDLEEFNPDLFQTAYSIYNTAHRNIAVYTFKQALITQAYKFLGADKKYAYDTAALVDVFDNLVFKHVKGLADKDTRVPGSVVQGQTMDSVYKRRSETAEARAEWLIANGYPQRVADLMGEPACASDDEAAVIDGQTVYFVKTKPERSRRMTAFCRFIDKTRNKEAALRRRGTRNARVRILPEDQIAPEESTLRKLPEHVPLDWFDVNAFNKMPASLRIEYKDSLIALPPDDYIVYTNPPHPWKFMTDDEFMRTYGNIIKSSYLLPTKEEEINMGASSDQARADFLAGFTAAEASGSGSSGAGPSGSASSSRRAAGRSGNSRAKGKGKGRAAMDVDEADDEEDDMEL